MLHFKFVLHELIKFIHVNIGKQLTGQISYRNSVLARHFTLSLDFRLENRKVVADLSAY